MTFAAACKTINNGPAEPKSQATNPFDILPTDKSFGNCMIFFLNNKVTLLQLMNYTTS